MDISGKKFQTQNLAEQISKVFDNSNTRVFEFIPIKNLYLNPNNI
jgi:hypothetical protein